MAWNYYNSIHSIIELPAGKYWIGDVSFLSCYPDGKPGAFRDDTGKHLVFKKITVSSTYLGTDTRDYHCKDALGIVSAECAYEDDPDETIGTYISSGKPVYVESTSTSFRVDYSGRRYILIRHLE